MSALVPDIITSSQTWSLLDPSEYDRLLRRIVNSLYPGQTWQRYTSINPLEWSGPGVYSLQIRLNRPEGRPLYSLKWEGPP
jgi:hypothetical protein